MMSRMTPQDIEKLAQLSRLSIDEEGKAAFSCEIEAILGYVSEIKNGAQGDVGRGDNAPHNVFRDDGDPHESGAYTKAILENAPRSEDGYVTVKNIF
jgi:aspartyl/glutamyl-tRNA(Asn/Gln) amidotransferase C subunit